jgi:anti-sigma factor RsiW
VNAPVCTRLGDLLARREADRLSASEERLLREHLASCDACAAEALRTDPVLLFARDTASSSPEVLTADERERFVGAVLAATGAARAERRIHPGRLGPGLRIAASLLLAASLVGVWFSRGRTPAPPGGAAAPVAIARDARPVPAEAIAPLEEVGGAGTVVYQFPPTAPGEPTVVFVVDRNADI